MWVQVADYRGPKTTYEIVVVARWIVLDGAAISIPALLPVMQSTLESGNTISDIGELKPLQNRKRG